MPAPFFTTNESEITRVEGLYIKERNPPSQITGAFLGVVGVTGETVRGPVDVPVEITNETDFKSIFGGRDQGNGGAIVNKVWLSMLNKPFGKVVVVRAADDGAATASDILVDGSAVHIVTIEATSPGAWGGFVTYDVKNATDGNSNHFNLVVTYLGTVYTYENLDLHAGADNSLAVIGDSLSNVVKLVKIADGRPVNAASQTLGVSGASPTAGSDGSIADADFTASGRGLNQVKAYKGVGTVWIAERSSSALKSAISTAAAASSDRLFLIGADSETVDKATATAETASYIGDRVVYCFNHAYTLDPETATSVVTQPQGWMASILSQIDVDIHPGEEDTKQYTAGIQRLFNENFDRDDYADFKAAGICALEKDDGFAFVSGVTTNNVNGKKEITRRRSTDFLELSIASELKHSVKKKNVKSRRDSNFGIISGFLADLADAERVVDKKDDGSPAFQLVRTTSTQDTLNEVERMLMRVKLIGHMLEIVLETEIGVGVTFTQIQ